MSNQEICITKFELQDSKGHLGNLRTNWTHVPTIPVETLSESKGASATAVQNSLKATTQVSASFQTLLDNSVEFFTRMGIAFQESDEAASQNIDSITCC